MMITSSLGCHCLGDLNDLFLATLSVETNCPGLMDGSRLFITLMIWLILSVLRRNPNRASSIPSVRFSSTVS